MRPLAPMLALTLALAPAAGPAAASEVWFGDWGRIVWEADLGITAVLHAEGTGGAAPRRLYVEGLTLDAAGRRSSYDGIWTAAGGEGGCALSLVDPVSAQPTPYWGTFRITFVGRTAPSAWAGVWGDCTDTPLNAFGAEPVPGE